MQAFERARERTSTDLSPPLGWSFPDWLIGRRRGGRFIQLSVVKSFCWLAVVATLLFSIIIQDLSLN
jgi:hypothetical protein